MSIHRSLAIAVLALLASPVWASPAESVITPDIEEGEREIELAFGIARSDGGERSRGLTIGFGAGITDRWATEVGFEFEQEGSDDFEFGGIEWENRIGLIVDEDEPVALSLLVGLERPRERAEGWSSTLGLLSESTPGRFLVNANLLLARTWDATDAGGDEAEGTTLGYQWQTLYRHSHFIYFGLQGMGDVGRWNDWADAAEQEHLLGPAIFGRVKLDGRRLNYDVGLLFGLTDGSPEHTLRLQLEYEF